MIRFIGRRLLWTIPTLFIITFLVFIAIRIGTDPVQSYLRLNPRASEAKVQQYRVANGLTGNIVSQYFNWLGHFVTFDWGRSIKGSRPVWPELKAAMANTLVLGTLATVVGVVIGLGIGILSAMRPRSVFDQASTTGAFVGISIPPYVSAILLQLFFAITLTRWLGLDRPLLPTSGVYPAGHKGFVTVLIAAFTWAAISCGIESSLWHCLAWVATNCISSASVSARTWNPQPPAGWTSRHPSCLYGFVAMVRSSCVMR